MKALWIATVILVAIAADQNGAVQLFNGKIRKLRLPSA